jgi:hypothetical protein
LKITSINIANSACVLSRLARVKKARQFRTRLTKVSKSQQNHLHFPGEPPYKVQVKAACYIYLKCKDLRYRKRS